jgi:uroporphyrinogen-III synthase
MSERRGLGRLWITRAEPQAQRTAEAVRQLGWTPVVNPLLLTRPLTGVQIGAEPDALAFTSQAAVAAHARLQARRDLPVFCVGEATARAAREAGFSDVRGPAPGDIGDARALAARIGQVWPRPALVLNPTAREPAVDLEKLLAERGVTARAVAVYETVAAPTAPPPPDLAGVLVQSAKAARILARLITAQASEMTLWALSPSVAEPLSGIAFRRVVVAARPDETALLERLGT